MPWLTLSQAARRCVTREDWVQRVERGEVESYVDAQGSLRVWLDPSDPLLGALHGFEGELLRLRAEVHRLQSELARITPAPSASARLTRLPPPPLPAEPVAVEPEPTCPRVAGLLAEVDRAWSGSDRELERQAGLPHRFLTKARRGERNGEKSQDSWTRLLEFLGARRAA